MIKDTELSQDTKIQRKKELGKALAHRDKIWFTPRMDLSDEMLERIFKDEKPITDKILLKLMELYGIKKNQ